MTNENQIVVSEGTPLVQVVFPSNESHTFLWADAMREGDDLATISDAALIARAANWLDRDVTDFANLIVTRPRTGNILISPKPVYGDGKSTTGSKVIDAFISILAATLAAIELSLQLLIISAYRLLVIPLLSALAGYIIGWGLAEVFTFAGSWIVTGANAFGLPWSLSTLPVAATFIGFAASFFRPNVNINRKVKVGG